MSELFESLTEEDLIIKDVSQKDAFPDSSKFTYLFDITEFVINSNSPVESLSFSNALKKYQRRLDMLFGRRRQNAIIVNLLKIPRRYIPNTKEGFEEDISIIPDNYVPNDIAKTFSPYGHFMIEFNLSVSDTIYWLYLLKIICQIADEFNPRKIFLIHLSLSSLPVEVHNFSYTNSLNEEVLNVLKGSYQVSFPLLEQFMTDVIFCSKDAQLHNLIHLDVAQRIASNYISAINTNHRNAKRPIRLAE